jgi:hypothetical protein
LIQVTLVVGGSSELFQYRNLYGRLLLLCHMF